MGDKINNIEIFKKLNIDESNQWIFYDERFHNFFDFLSNNITDVNILSETDILEYESLTSNEILSDKERCEKLTALESIYPGLLTVTSNDIKNLQQKIDIKQKMLMEYDELVDEMRKTKEELDRNLHRLEATFKLQEKEVNDSFSFCLEKAKQLEDIQNANNKKFAEIENMFIEMHSPPLFMHQMPLDQYFMACDSFMQHFSLHLRKYFNMLDFTNSDNSLSSLSEKTIQLENLKTLIQQYQMRYLKEMADLRGIQNMIDNLNLNKVNILNLNDMERESHDLAIHNSYQNIACNNFLNDLKNYVEQHSKQTIELVLLKNTKNKMERAQERYKKVMSLSNIVSKALLNAELVWIAVQLDSEKLTQFCKIENELKTDLQQCLKHNENNRHVLTAGVPRLVVNDFLIKFSQLLSEYLKQQISSDQKSCLYEYEKFKRLLNFAKQSLIQQKHYSYAKKQLKELESVESILQAFVYDGPVMKPTIENVHYLKTIYDANLKKQQIHKNLRSLRSSYIENIKERMEKDQMWRYQQMLWIWFLTDPQKLVHAIEEVRRNAIKLPQIKSLGGIKRK